MTPSIKRRIIEQVLTNLEPLKSTHKVRVIERALDIEALSKQQPSLQVYDGEEAEVGKDNRGHTYTFPLAIKVTVREPRDIGAAKDDLVAAVQAIMEHTDNLQLSGLANWVDGGDEVPFIAEITKPIGGALVLYTVQYRRLRGDPYNTY